MLANAIERCLIAAEDVQSITEFKAWARNEVSLVLGHGCLACGHGRITSAGVSMDHVVLVDYPIEHLRAIENPAGGIDTPLMRRWLATRRPVYFETRAPWPGIDASWLAKFTKHDLRNAAADAVFDEDNFVGTYFSFHRLPEIDSHALDAVFLSLTPVLHATLVRAITDAEKHWFVALQGLKTLTTKERAIAQWIGMGKSNSEVAELVGAAESTVKRHLSTIMDKMGCSNRAGVAVFASRWFASPLALGTKVL
ncbi:helix-turn-helix transcriptional regulator [Ralstonia nicotianae]